MTAAPAPTGQAKTIRWIHGALATGVVLFAIVAYFVRPQLGAEPLPPIVVNVLLLISLAACATSLLFLRGRVPRRSMEESPVLFWTRAALPALFSWAALEGGGLLAVVNYILNGSSTALVVTGIAVLGMIAVSPGRLERV